MPPSKVETISLGVKNSPRLPASHHTLHLSVWTTRRFGLLGFSVWSTPNVLPTQSKTSFAAELMSSQSNAMALWMPIPYGRRMTTSTPGVCTTSVASYACGSPRSDSLPAYADGSPY